MVQPGVQTGCIPETAECESAGLNPDTLGCRWADTLGAYPQVVMVKGFIRLNVDKWAVAGLAFERC